MYFFYNLYYNTVTTSINPLVPELSAQCNVLEIRT